MSADNSMVDDDTSSLGSHLFNTTFSTHRVSPLYLGSWRPLDEPKLRTLAQRLRTTLVGDVVRGVEVGLDGTGEDATLGALELVELQWVEMASLLRENSASQALLITLQYENASCAALLLPPVTEEDGAVATAAQTGLFVSLPLLLLRMPASLKPFIIDWISGTFDCRISPLRLGTRTLVRFFESWIKEVGAPSRGPLAKDAVITIGFYVPPTENDDSDEEERVETAGKDELALKSIDVIISPADLGKFVQGVDGSSSKGRQPPATWETDDRRRRKLAGGKEEEGWSWREASGNGEHTGDEAGATGQPFTESLARYMDEHLALDMFHPGARITKIACAGFVVSEARLKIFVPPSSSDDQGSPVPGPLSAIRSIIADLTGEQRAA